MWKWVPCHKGTIGKPTFLGWKIEIVQNMGKRLSVKKIWKLSKAGKSMQFSRKESIWKDAIHKERNFTWGGHIFYFALKETNMETLPKLHTWYISQGGRISSLGLVIKTWKHNPINELTKFLKRGSLLA